MTTDTIPGPEFQTVAEVAARMRISKMTVNRLIHAGTLEAVRVGRNFRVPAAAVNAYLAGVKVVPKGGITE